MPRRRSWLRRLASTGLWLLLTFVLILIFDGWRGFGKQAEGDRAERMYASPQWGGSAFVNPQKVANEYSVTISELLFDVSPDATPSTKIPVVDVDPKMFDKAPPSGLRVTWFGHSSMLVEIDGKRILTDPVWGDRSGPWTWIGPSRWYPPPLPLEDLPDLDAVIISHDHYDHLDYPTIVALSTWDTTFITPLGVGAHLEYWGVPAARIVELDWWDEHDVDGLKLVCTPARHASGRMLIDNDATLWAGYALIGERNRVFFSGDTGLFPAMREIGERFGPFDLTMIEAGAYGAGWPDWHIGPEQAVTAHAMLRGKVYMPVHWGLFNLAYHGWTEPLERTLVATEAAGVAVYIPKPGSSFEPAALPAVDRWWPELPWRTAEQYPIVSRLVD